LTDQIKFENAMKWKIMWRGGEDGKENLKLSIPSIGYVTDISLFKHLNGHVIQVQTLSGFP